MHFTIKNRANGGIIASGVERETMQVFEGNWYFQPDAVDMSQLRVTERTYTCPYKGTCYWIDLESETGRAQNVGWVYRTPKPGYEFIQDQIGFYARDTAGTTAEKA